MKLIFLLIIINYSLSLLVFPFKIRENNKHYFESPTNNTKTPILKYLYHILNDYELVSEVDIGNPKQKVELLFNFNDNYVTLLGDSTSTNPYFYNLSTTYTEIIINDKNLGLKVDNSVTIKETLYMKNEFCENLDEFMESKSEVKHEFIIIFSKYLPSLKPISHKFFDSNAMRVGLLWNSKYNGEHGIYKPFFNEVKEKGFIENYLHFLYYFDEYEGNLYPKKDNLAYEGLFVFGKYPHEVMPDKYDVKNLYWTQTFLTRSKIVEKENILWGIKFNQVYIDYGNNKKQFEFLRGIFDLSVEYIFPPYEYYETIKNFFRPLRKICFIDSNDRIINQDVNIYRMVYCDYEEFGKKYLKTFPKLVFKIDDFDEEFEFTYEDLFKPVYDNKYYLFLIFTGRFWRASEYIVQFPSYPWTLGRIFFKKYQFVFDSLNKRVGYYKTTNNKANKEDSNKSGSDIIKEKDIIKEEDNKNKEDNKKEDKNSNGNVNEENIVNSVFFVVFIVVISIIIVLVVGFYLECLMNKSKRKKRMNELIDEPEYIPKEDNLNINNN